ncbi:MAG TPA: zinc-finger domain-containing protein [Rhodopila sp.]
MPDGAAAPNASPASPTEIIHVDSRTVACDGGDGALGHPRVFLRIPGESVMCPYCSRLYVLNPGADHDGGH